MRDSGTLPRVGAIETSLVPVSHVLTAHGFVEVSTGVSNT